MRHHQVPFLCREHSSVGLERLLDKQEVCGSNPHVPTNENQAVTAMQLLFSYVLFSWFTAVFSFRVKPGVKPENHMAASISILCYKSKMLANGAHPLMIRVCKDGRKELCLCAASSASDLFLNMRYRNPAVFAAHFIYGAPNAERSGQPVLRCAGSLRP